MRIPSGKVLVLGMVLLTLSVLPAVAADGPVWTYVEAGYINVDVDNLSDSGDNYFLGGSFGIKWFHINGSVAKGDLGPDVEQEQWSIGAGWHGLLGKRADLLAEAAYIDFSVDDGGPVDGDSTGYRATVGVRFRPINLFEADAFYHYTDFDSISDTSSESDTSWELRGIFFIWRLGFGASMEQADESEQWNAFVRFNFGR